MYGCCQPGDIGALEVCMACFPFIAYGGACYEIEEKGKVPKTVLAAVLPPCAGCYIRTNHLDQGPCKACVLECLSPFSCAPCHMAQIATHGIQREAEM
jgi:hypothetical protein